MQGERHIVHQVEGHGSYPAKDLAQVRLRNSRSIGKRCLRTQRPLLHLLPQVSRKHMSYIEFFHPGILGDTRIGMA